jgi:hypothetical protein
LSALVEKNVGVSFAGVQLIEVFRDHLAFGIGPGSRADAAPRIRRLVAVVGIFFRAQVRAPGPIAGADGAREILASLIGSAQAAQVSGLVPGTCNEKGHLRAGLSALGSDALFAMTAERSRNSYRNQEKKPLHESSLR